MSSLWIRPQKRFATDSPLEGDGFELPVPRLESAVRPDVGKGDAARPEVGKAADGGQMAWSIRRWRLEVFGSSYGERRSDCASRISRRRFLIKGVERSASFRLKWLRGLSHR